MFIFCYTVSYILVISVFLFLKQHACQGRHSLVTEHVNSILSSQVGSHTCARAKADISGIMQ